MIHLSDLTYRQRHKLLADYYFYHSSNMNFPTGNIYANQDGFHCLDGPAIHEQFCVEYWTYGYPHRIDGPAFIHKTIGKTMVYHFLHGLYFSKPDWPTANPVATALWAIQNSRQSSHIVTRPQFLKHIEKTLIACELDASRIQALFAAAELI